MPKETITVKYLNPPREGKKRGSIKTTDDRFFGVFPETIHLFNVGGTYEIEYTDGEYANVKPGSVKQVASSAPLVPAVAPPPPRAGEGGEGEALAHVRTDYFRQTHPIDAERMFVCSLLNAAIAKGLVTLDRKQLAETTLMLRGLWNYAFVANARDAQKAAG
jgi:hypothetical protein